MWREVFVFTMIGVSAAACIGVTLAAIGVLLFIIDRPSKGQKS